MTVVTGRVETSTKVTVVATTVYEYKVSQP